MPDVARVVADLSRRQPDAPTTGDVAAALGFTVQHTRRLLLASVQVFEVPAKPAPRWYCRDRLPTRIEELRATIARALDLARNLPADEVRDLGNQVGDALTEAATLVNAMEGRR